MFSGPSAIMTYLAAALSLLLVASLVHAAWRGRNPVAKGRRWTRTIGVVIESTVEGTAAATGGCRPNIRYTYRVGGLPYLGDVVDFSGESGTTRVRAEKVAAKYPTGAKVDVFYDPQQPKSAVLEGGSAFQPAIYAMVAVFLCISIALVAHAIAGTFA